MSSKSAISLVIMPLVTLTPLQAASTVAVMELTVVAASVVFKMLNSMEKLLAAFATGMADASAVHALSAVLPMVAVVASTTSSVAYAVAAMALSEASTVSAIALLVAAAEAAMASPAAAKVAVMALPASATFVVFAMSTLIVGLPVVSPPPMAAASMPCTPVATLPLTSMSVCPL